MNIGQRKSVLMIAAPYSGSGKTVVTLALLRALRARGVEICGAKAGPDYIDPGFHQAACGLTSVNLDPWAMCPARLIDLAERQRGSFLLVEAMMGLFDGAADGTGSAADLASVLGAPVLLVIDSAKQSHSVAALARGFRDHRNDIKVAGVILNRVASARHETMLRRALADIGMPVLGAVRNDERLCLPDRHLGLVQAGEHPDIEAFIASAADAIAGQVDLDELEPLFAPLTNQCGRAARLPPLGQRIAVARDAAFSFVYPHVLSDWHDQGASVEFFSPLADDEPNADCDAIYLPGGYPELYGGVLAQACRFRSAMQRGAQAGKTVYGECGGYMVLGEGLIDAQGKCHAMCGLLPLETSFQLRRRHLGYRRISAADGFPFGRRLAGHEFHYSTAVWENGEPLFRVSDATDSPVAGAGLRKGGVMGSYIHVIDGVVS